MSVSCKPRGLAIAGALLLCGLAVFLFIRSAGPEAGQAGQVSPDTEVRDPSVPRGAPADPDWTTRIESTPAPGRTALMREILAIEDASLRIGMATALSELWMRDDIDEFLEFVDMMRVDEGPASEMMRRFSVALIGAFETVTGKAALVGKQRYVAEAIVDYLVATDADGAESWVREHLVGLDLDLALGAIAEALVSRSPDQAMRVLASIGSVSARLTASPAVAAALAKKDPEAALAWAGSIQVGTERTLAMASIVDVLAASDARGAAAILQDYLRVIQADYEGRLERDRVLAGVKVVDDFETPELYEEYLEGNGLQQDRPYTPDADYLLNTAERIALQWAKTDPAGALAWAESLAVGIARAHAISGALSGWSIDAPEQALGHYLAHYDYDTILPLYIFENWAQGDPHGAVPHIDTLRDPAQKSAAIQGLTKGWLVSDSDLPGLSAWVDTLPEGGDRDAANLAIISHASDSDPESAWQRVTGIGNPDSRRRAAREVITVLAVTDPTLARTALANYQGSPEEVDSLNRIIAEASLP
jgi:hypothetical protein